MTGSKSKVVLLPIMGLGLLLSACGGNSSSSTSGGSVNHSTSDSGSVPSGTLVPSTSEEASVTDVGFTGKLKIYYHNDESSYATKRIWVWCNGVNGAEYPFDNIDSYSTDDFGVYKIFDLSAAPYAGNVTNTFSFIIKNANTWDGQSTDTIIRFGRFINEVVDDVMTVYSCPGEGGDIDTFPLKKDALGDRIATASFTDWKTLKVVGGGTSTGREASEVGKVASYSLYGFDNSYYRLSSSDQASHKQDYLLKSESPNSNSFNITLDADATPTTAYVVEAYMALDTTRKKSKTASFVSLFDTSKFKSDYVYSGSDLGYSGDHSKMTWKVWAPTSSRVRLKLFFTGVPGSICSPYDESADWGSVTDMELGKQGVWQISLSDDDYLSNDTPYFYTYLVTNAAGENEVCDPYAHATGVDGKRAAVLDFSTLEMPSNWSAIDANFTYGSGSLLPKITSANQLSVYEAHIRDLTADKTWVSNKGYRNGTYQAFAERGTSYSGTVSSKQLTVTTGHDHIAEQKYSAIQLLPVFDSDNEERWTTADGSLVTLHNPGDAVTAPSYNWGYNPLNYSVVEGCYSSNPFDPTVRIKEFRDLIASYAEDGTRIIMDVVYNHVSSVNNSNLTKLVPYYYFRTNAEGYYTNGSGVGNETATERPMMSKLIVDSLCWWASEYKIKGFRFDVMGVLDQATMKAASLALYKIDPTIVLYGEGWTGDGSVGMDDISKGRATAASCYKYLYPGQTDCPIGIGCFNSPGKEALKGNEKLGWGFMNKGDDWADTTTSKGSFNYGVMYMMNGHCTSVGGTDYGANPTQTVNYASCHDNYTQYDAMNYTIGTTDTSGADSTAAMEATIASCAAVLFSEGIAFTQGGEEIFRQKLMAKDNEYYDTIASDDAVTLKDGTKLVRNSYMYGDAVNSYKWDRKVKYNSYYLRFQAACVARASVVDSMLGRPYFYEANNPCTAKGISTWGDSINHGAGLAYQMLDNSAHYAYSFLIGRISTSSSTGTTSVGMGSGTYRIIYDSYNRGTSSITVGTDYTFTAHQNEFLVIANY